MCIGESMRLSGDGAQEQPLAMWVRVLHLSGEREQVVQIGSIPITLTNTH